MLPSQTSPTRHSLTGQQDEQDGDRAVHAVLDDAEDPLENLATLSGQVRRDDSATQHNFTSLETDWPADRLTLMLPLWKEPLRWG
jgi:hypothetical protein